MNDYITLDGNKYATLQRSWRPTQPKGSTARVTLNGGLDVTYGALTVQQWNGEIVGDVTSRGAGWGTIATLRTTLAKRTSLGFTDHYGNSYTVHQIGGYQEAPFSPGWDNAESVIYVAVQLVGT